MLSIKTIITKITAITCVAGILMVANFPLIDAYEAHIINVTAEIKNDIPKINPPGGEFCNDGRQPEVILSVDLADAKIYYTLDGSNPVCYDTSNSILYTEPSGTGPFFLYDAATVKAVSCHDGSQSAVMSEYFDVSEIYCEPTLMISKVYYDVCNKTDGSCGKYKGEEGDNEWVEIYNPTSNPIDIKNWKICDNHSCDILSLDDLFIPAGGYAVITGKATTWNYWDIPSDAVKIVLADGKIGGGLSNSGDRVILLRPNGTEVDAMSYGNDTFIFNPSCPDVAEGNMLGRIPLDPGPGYQDTNTAADWKNLGLPAVGGITVSPLQDEYCGRCNDENYTCSSPSDPNCHCAPGLYYKQQMDIAWTMTNPVGNDDASVKLVYIIDRDCSGDISDGDLPYYTLENYTLASGASISETYTWTGWTSDDDLLHWDERKEGWWKDKEGNNVPYFYGFTWIQITAVGSENFMIKDSNASIAMFEPLPPGISFKDRCSILGDSCDECRSGSKNNSGAGGLVSGDDNEEDKKIIAKEEDVSAVAITNEVDDNTDSDEKIKEDKETEIGELEDKKTNEEVKETESNDTETDSDDKDEEEDKKIVTKEEDASAVNAAGDTNDNGDGDAGNDKKSEDKKIVTKEEENISGAANIENNENGKSGTGEEIGKSKNQEIEEKENINNDVTDTDSDGNKDNDDNGKKIIAREEDIDGAAVVADGAGDVAGGDSDDKDNEEDKKIIAKEEDVSAVAITNEVDDNTDSDEKIKEDKETNEEVKETKKLGNEKIGGEKNDSAGAGGDNSLPIPDDGGTTEIEFSLT